MAWSRTARTQEIPFRADAFVLGQLAQSRAWGINYLLGVGPTKDGEFVPEIYEHMAVVGAWMKRNGASVLDGAKPLPTAESASVFATANGPMRYLFAIPAFAHDGKMPQDQLPPKDETLILRGIAEPKTVQLLASGTSLKFSYAAPARELKVDLPASIRTKLVDVVAVELR